MKKFIVKTILFSCVLGCFYVLLFNGLKYRLKKKVSNSKAIILGDSHTEFIHLPNVFNYSSKGLPYIVHYRFVDTFLNQLEKKRVIIAYGHHNLAPHFENRFSKDIVFPGWLPMVNREIKSLNLINKSFNYDWEEEGEFSNVILKNKIAKLYELNFRRDEDSIISYSGDTVSFLRTLNKHYNREFKKTDKIQKKYLALIIDELVKIDCKIYLLNTPVTDFYFKHIPSEIKEEYNYMVGKHNNLELIDLNKILKLDSTCYVDADHVNKKGNKLIKDYITDKVLKDK